MRIFAKCLLTFAVLIAVPGTRAEPGRLVQDIWNAAYLGKAKAGYFHTSVREIEQNGKKLFRTVSELRLTVMRETEQITLRMETGSDETEEGVVTRVMMRQFLGKQQQLVLIGTVENGELHVRVDGGKRQEKRIPWNDKVVGLYRQERLFQERHVKPADTFSYLSYEPTINSVVNTQVFVKNYENPVAGRARQPLLRVEAVPDKVAGLQLPTLVSWLGDDLQTVRSEVPIPGLGKLTLERTSEGEATKKSSAATVAGINSLVPLNRPIANPYQTRSAVYRITLKDDENPASAFAQDSRQEIKNVEASSFNLHVKALRRPEPVQEESTVGDEFLSSSFFINSEDPNVKRRALEAVGSTVDPWEKALKIEKYVHERMVNKNLTEAFATADQVAQTMEGDCTEHAVLAAAMCRAVGVPSRTAIGLVYVDHPRRGPSMGFHMWAEVWVHGRWMPIDATLGQGYVGAAHIKITDHSWHKTESLTPLLPVVRVLDKLTIEVLKAE